MLVQNTKNFNKIPKRQQNINQASNNSIKTPQKIAKLKGPQVFQESSKKET